MRPSKATGHSGASDVTVFGKKLRKQWLWKVKKIRFTRGFRVLQLPKIIEKRGENDVKKI
jgi:hypothetical protein